MYAVDNEQRGKKGWNWDFILGRKKHLSGDYPSHSMEWNAGRLIIASNDPALKELPMLPDVEEDDGKLAADKEFKLTEEFANTIRDEDEKEGMLHSIRVMRRNYLKGYKADSKKQYTREQVKKLLIEATNEAAYQESEFEEDEIEKYLDSLDPKPIAVELEMEHENYPLEENSKYTVIREDRPMKLVVENNFVKVKRWVYE